jgi:hypothetical protein
MTKLHHRLRRIEADLASRAKHLQHQRCPDCRHWCGIEIIEYQTMPDASHVPLGPVPGLCPTCGWKPDCIIEMISDTNDQATRYLADIKHELEYNESLRAGYPGATGRGRVWKTDAIRLRNGVEIGAYGTGTKLRGRKRDGLHRPSLIVVDDPQNRDHIVSAVQRERTWDWLVRDVSNAGDGQTNIVVLGTALHRECIVCRLDTVPGWRTRSFRSIEKWPERMDLWKEWEDLQLSGIFAPPRFTLGSRHRRGSNRSSRASFHSTSGHPR